MKKATAIAAMLAMALSLTACGGSGDTSLIGKLAGQGADTKNSSSAKINTEITQNDKKMNDTAVDKGNIEIVTTAKTEKIAVTETTMQNKGNFLKENKALKFDGGIVSYAEYKYYVTDDYGNATEYVSFSANITFDNYPDSEKTVNDILNDIGNPPSDEVLAASKAPESTDMIKRVSYTHLASVCIENNLLFISANYLNENKDQEDFSVTSEATYVFDIRTGSQLEIEQCFKNFDDLEEIIYLYAPRLIWGYIDFDDYEWYYDGKKFTFKFEMYGKYDGIADIPADVIRPYFAYGNETTANIPSKPSPLSDFEYDDSYEAYCYIEKYIGNDSVVVIPDEISGLPIEISSWAFSYCKADTVEIPNGISWVSPLAFENSSCNVIYNGKTYSPNQYPEFYDAANTANAKTAAGYDFKYIEYDGYISLIKYTGNDTTVVVPSEINGMPVEWINSAFAYTNVKEVIIPEGVIGLGDCTFTCCYNLESVVLPNTVSMITGQTFYNCPKLTNINVPYNDMLMICDDAFEGCPGLAGYDFPDYIMWF